METNGISLNTNREEKSDRTSLFIGLVAGLGLAAALGCAFMLGGCNAGERGAEATQRVVEQSGGSDAGDSDANGNGGSVDEPIDVSEPTDEHEQPADEGDEPADEPTATATPDAEEPEEDEPTPTPTATPDFECEFCPDLDLVAEEPVVPPCGDDCVIDGGLILELPDLAFEETSVKFCEGYVAISAEITGHGEIWVTYEKEWNVTTDSEHQFPESFFLGETGTWAWFGSWGWIYPYDFVFHAEDAEGNHIQKEVMGDYVC